MCEHAHCAMFKRGLWISFPFHLNWTERSTQNPYAICAMWNKQTYFSYSLIPKIILNSILLVDLDVLLMQLLCNVDICSYSTTFVSSLFVVISHMVSFHIVPFKMAFVICVKCVQTDWFTDWERDRKTIDTKIVVFMLYLYVFIRCVFMLWITILLFFFFSPLSSYSRSLHKTECNRMRKKRRIESLQ